MDEFSIYLEESAKHEGKKRGVYLSNSRNRILVYAGIHLNWLDDFFANVNIKLEKLSVFVNGFEDLIYCEFHFIYGLIRGCNYSSCDEKGGCE